MNPAAISLPADRPGFAAIGGRARAWLRRLRLSHVLNVGAVLLLSASLAKWTWMVLTPPAASPIATYSETSGVPTLDVDIQSLLAAELFGHAVDTRERGARAMEQMPISRLNLVLTGVVIAQTHSLALIGARGRPEEPFAVGQPIVNGAVLQAILSDRVLIHHGGTLETVLLETASTVPRANPTPIKALPAFKAAAQAVRVNSPAKVSAESITRLENDQYIVERDFVNSQLRSADFLSQARLMPHPEGGFMAVEIQPGSVYEKLGLQVGDVIRGVNGQAMNTLEDAMKAYQQLNDLDHVELEFVRAGKIQYLYYMLK